MENDVITPKYTIFDLGYERNLTKTDSFYDSDPTNTDKVTASLPSILISGGGLAGNITMVDGFLQSSNYVAGSTGWKLTNDTAYLPAIDLSGYLLATGGAYKTAATGSRVEIFPDANTGIIAYDDAGDAVLTVLVGGTDQGDVVIGDFANSKGVMWDKSAGTFIVKGSIVTEAGSEISGEYIDALNVGKLTAGEIVSKAITLSFTEGAGDCYIAAGKTDFTYTESGFIMGIDDSDSNKVKFIIGNSTEYLAVIGDTFINTLRVGGYTAGNTQLIASDAEKSDADTTDATIMKQIQVGRDGTYRITFDVRSVNTQSDSRTGRYRITKYPYWNLYGYEYEVTQGVSGYADSGWVSMPNSGTLDITLTAGQSVYLYAYNDGGVTAYVRNFKIKVSALNEITAPSVIVA